MWRLLPVCPSWDMDPFLLLFLRFLAFFPLNSFFGQDFFYPSRGSKDRGDIVCCKLEVNLWLWYWPIYSPVVSRLLSLLDESERSRGWGCRGWVTMVRRPRSLCGSHRTISNYRTKATHSALQLQHCSFACLMSALLNAKRPQHPHLHHPPPPGPLCAPLQWDIQARRMRVTVFRASLWTSGLRESCLLKPEMWQFSVRKLLNQY